ncbi:MULTISPECIES: chemotaxis protein CheB [Methylomicrobium]|uniref:Methylase of chemotaxis methyl-accepting protein n=1 Tax=Methylomicrobium album BG8 TaxID=686340 RepID=H8GNB2_METAL|nr:MULTISPECIES: chemotaxis protein CheB [Methylomicrobium]EIC28341.1 methylase of chemotaxis methyl-accepting protein [Methylomicrobium album BG8]
MKKPPSSSNNSSDSPSRPSEDKAVPFKVVGIGASAGGLEAFEEFFQHMPADSGIAFVLVPHLDPSHASLLTEILQRSTRMPVVEVQDQMPVASDEVYVIPPNRDMEIFHGKIQLSVPNVPRGKRLPVDAFLRSLAEDQKENAVGIIFSGTGTDGTLGCRAILGAGGVTYVQEPATARYDGMPSSVIQAGYATRVLPVDKMPDALIAEPGKIRIAGTEKAAAKGEPASRPKTESGMMRILLLLRSITGHDFSLYKESTIGRRIERCMLQNDIKDTDTYIRYLKEKPDEVHTLFKELLINVTSFFRDPEAFATLEETILPQLCKDKPEGAFFRVWVAGCATGEEAYSIAIILREMMDKLQKELKVQIYSTDLDEDAIAIARTGLYPPNIAQDVTPERLRRFFLREDNGYRVKKEIREMIVFAVQNVIKDPPFTKLDLLCCRNLLIYLKPELQDKLIPAFHYALKPDGALFLSPSESIGNHHELFKVLNRKWKLYRAVHSITSARTMMAQGISWGLGAVTKTPEESMKTIRELNIAELTRRILVQFFAPVSVITDHKGDILFIHGETGKYLRPAPGQPSHNIIEMAREGLGMELRTALHIAASERIQILNRQIQVRTNGGFSPINLSVRPIANPDASQNLLLISFEDVAVDLVKPVRKRAAKPGEQGRIEELERELEQLKTSYRASIEEQQASNEELKSANEEMQSTNEELQSTNEELETSKEELQSVNEELVTVNSELQAKIEQLAGMQNDMKNLLDNINVGIIFLDRNLIIRRFTREAVRIYRLVPSDVGRPLNDIKSVINGDDLHHAAQAVLETLIPYERELYIGDNTWMMVRIQPYRTLDNIIDGVVMTFTDITSRKAIVEQDAVVRAESLVNTIRKPLAVLNESFQIMSASQSFYSAFEITPEEVVGHPIDQLNIGFTALPELRKLLENVLRNDQPIDGYGIIADIPGVGQRRIKINASRITGKIAMPQMILLSMEINP